MSRIDTAASGPEALRLLRAAGRGAMRVNEHGRYVVTSEPRPNREVREELFSREYLTWPSYRDDERKVRITNEGRGHLQNLEGAFAAARRGQKGQRS